MTRAHHRHDADARLVRHTAWTVGAWITVAASLLVLAVLVSAFTIVLHQIPLHDLLDRAHHEETIDVGGLDVLVGAVVVGGLAIGLACMLSLIVTRRAVAPLVDALARQRRFVADASHELRTPLAVLDARLQVLERSLHADDPHREIVGQLRQDSHALIAIVGDLLDSVDVTTTGRQPPVRLAPVVETAVALMSVLAADRGVRIDAEPVAADLTVRLPEASLQRALMALLDNAVKHSAEGTAVEVSTRASRGRVHIAVRDHGPGIRGIAPERIFDRFARSADAADQPPGFGIGLSLVQDTAGRVGGAVEVTETSAAGTTITISLPASQHA